MSENSTVLGIDIGSVSLAAVEIDSGGRILQRECVPHEGNVREALVTVSSRMDWSRVRGCAATGRNITRLIYDRSYDSRMACIRSVKERYPHTGAILLVGGEQFSLIRFDREGNYQSIRTNTSCAAGTGSFLDQQAGRLNMGNSAELSRTALENRDPVPLVATRCAVFAKTDLIHAQQEGYSLPGISEGLCQGLAANLVDTLFKDDDLEGPVLFTGGVSLNEAVYRHISSMIGSELLIDPDGPWQGAIGAALSLLDEKREGSVTDEELSLCSDGESLYKAEEVDRSCFYPPLTLRLSDYPDFSSYLSWDQPIQGRPGQPFVEVELFESWPEVLDCYMGIDIGSTSTKAVVCDTEGKVLGGFYTRTAGRPLEAVQALLEAVSIAAGKENTRLLVLGSATTGSGRKFIGNLIHADVVLDEISAHARAACELDPHVDTILEIGGQDAKFTTLKKRQGNPFCNE